MGIEYYYMSWMVAKEHGETQMLNIVVEGCRLSVNLKAGASKIGGNKGFKQHLLRAHGKRSLAGAVGVDWDPLRGAF